MAVAKPKMSPISVNSPDLPASAAPDPGIKAAIISRGVAAAGETAASTAPEPLVPEKRPIHPPKPKALSESIVCGLVGLVDGLSMMLSGVIFYVAMVGFNEATWQAYAAALAVSTLMSLAAFRMSRLYDFDAIVAWPAGVSRMVLATAVVGLIVVGLAFGLQISERFSPGWFLATFASAAITMAGCRGLTKALIRRFAGAGLLVRNVAIIGAGGQARHLVAKLKEQNIPWKRVIGVFDDRRTRIGKEVDGHPVLGSLDDLVSYVRRGKIHDVIITLPWSADARLVSIIGRLRELPVHIYLGSDLIGYHFPRHEQRLIEGIPVLEIATTPLAGWSGLLKALEDRILGTMLVLLFSPLLLVIWLAIKLDSPGPALFRQARYGFNNEVIVVYKFRTMYHNRPPETGVIQAQRNDSRITRIGRFLRRSSLDELPQLFNVVRGSMSLVGPRPHAIAHNEEYARLIGGYHGRHKVKPGITGWAQVNGLRGETETVDKMRARVDHDIHYIENWSLWFDIKIMVMTAFIGWVHKNAY